MWDVAKAAVLGKPKGDVGEGGDDGPGCGHLLFARAWGSFSAILVMVFAVLNFISCFQWSIYMLCLGFLTLLLEASFVAGLCDCSESFSQLLARIKPWQKAVLYCLISLPPLIACFGITTLLACGAWFGTGVVYFVLFMGMRRKMPHNVAYNVADAEAQVNLMAAATEDDATEKNDPPATEQSAWWPFSTTSNARPASSSQQPGQAKAQHASGEKKPESQPARQPAMTGAVPDDVPAAFPEPTLDDAQAGPRTTPYTGPPLKAVTVDGPTPVLTAPSAASGPRTLPYAGPLIKSFGDAKPS